MTRMQSDNRPDAWVAEPDHDAPDDPADDPTDISPLPQRVGRRIAPYLYLFSTVIFAGALAADPVGRIFIAPLILLAVIVAVLFLRTLVTARKELRALIGNRRVRVIHGLEHGCYAVLEERGLTAHSGQTNERSFDIVVGHDTSDEDVLSATRAAIQRFSVGETKDAYSPQCGTSTLVGLTLFSLVIVGCTVAAIVFGIGAGPAFMAAAVLGVIAQLAWRPLGLAAQRAFTVSTRFREAVVDKVVRLDDGGLRGRTFQVSCRVAV
jgi:hypothetical protein